MILDQDGYGATGYEILHGSNDEVRKKYSKSKIPLKKIPWINGETTEPGDGPGGFEINGHIDKDSQGKATVTMNYAWYDNVGYNGGFENATNITDAIVATITGGAAHDAGYEVKEFDIIIKWEDTFTYKNNIFEDGWFDINKMRCSTWLYPMLMKALSKPTTRTDFNLKEIYLFDISKVYRPVVDSQKSNQLIRRPHIKPIVHEEKLFNF